MSDYTLITGFPLFLTQCLARRLLETDPADRVALLCPGRFQVGAQIFVQELPPQARGRVEVLWGDPGDLDLGLSGADYRRLCQQATAIIHVGHAGHVGPAPRGREAPGREPAAVACARHIVEIGCDCPRLRCLCHVSSAFVAGVRVGVVLEEDLWLGQRFADARDEALLRAEQLVKQAAADRRLPLIVLRPSHVVGDSRTGETDHFGGPYALMQTLLKTPLDVEQLLPALGWGAAPLHMVPVDFVADATVTLLRDARALGLTFHLVDPCPLPLRAVGELLRQRERPRAPRGPTVPPRLLRAVLRAPGVDRLTRAKVVSLEETLGQMVYFNCQNTLRLLEGTGLRCPPVASYLDRLVAFYQGAQQGGGREEDVADPLD